MPRYLFDPDGADIVSVDLKDLDEARSVASELTSNMLKAAAPAVWNGDAWRLTVATDKGLMLFQVHVLVTDAAAVGGRRPR